MASSCPPHTMRFRQPAEIARMLARRRAYGQRFGRFFAFRSRFWLRGGDDGTRTRDLPRDRRNRGAILRVFGFLKRFDSPSAAPPITRACAGCAE